MEGGIRSPQWRTRRNISVFVFVLACSRSCSPCMMSRCLLLLGIGAGVARRFFSLLFSFCLCLLWVLARHIWLTSRHLKGGTVQRFALLRGRGACGVYNCKSKKRTRRRPPTGVKGKNEKRTLEISKRTPRHDGPDAPCGGVPGALLLLVLLQNKAPQ